jgi:NAD(P)-dependent dehydrogenase (short-subunit alcohol dehydrogenase family)
MSGDPRIASKGISRDQFTCGGDHPRRRAALSPRRHSPSVPLVLIAGGASGVGLACARMFAARGARLILCDSNGHALSRARDELGASSRFCDVTSESSVAIFAEEVLDQFLGIDVLINAAGDGYVRALGMMRISLALLPSMRRERTPKMIFNIAPDFQPLDEGEPLFPNVASPRNFRRLSASLAIQARGSAVRVATIMPRRAAGDIVGGAVGTKCDPADVVAAVMTAVFGKAAALNHPLSAVAGRTRKRAR